VRCQYTLRGLRISGRCPECGAPIRLSLQSHLLEFSDPDWIGSLASGGRIVIGALIAFVILSVPFTTLATVNYRHSNYVLWLGCGFLLALSAGVWRVTTPNPAVVGSERWCAVRKQVRVGLAAMCVVSLAHLLGPRLGVPRGTPMVAHAIAGPLGLLGLIALRGPAQFARDLARRLGERRVAAHAARVQAILVFTWAGMAIASSLLVMGGAFGRRTGDAVLLVLVVCGLGYTVSAVHILALPAQLVEPFRRCRAAAEANWAAALAAAADADESDARADPATQEPSTLAGSPSPAPDDPAARP